MKVSIGFLQVLGSITLGLLAAQSAAAALSSRWQQEVRVLAAATDTGKTASPGTTNPGAAATIAAGAASPARAESNAGAPAQEPVTIGLPTRVVVMGVCTLALLVLAAVLLSGQMRFLIVGEDNRYSNSKFQMALWFSVLIVSYTATLWLRWWKGDGVIGGIGIQPYLLALSGASAFTLGAAKGITTNKQATAVQAGLNPKVPAPKPRFPYDLMHNDKGQVDFGDFQMMVITLIVAVVYILQMFQFLGSPVAPPRNSLPEVDSTLLAAFGLGQGAYLTKKYAGNPGEA